MQIPVMKQQNTLNALSYFLISDIIVRYKQSIRKQKKICIHNHYNNIVSKQSHIPVFPASDRVSLCEHNRVQNLCFPIFIINLHSLVDP